MKKLIALCGFFGVVVASWSLAQGSAQTGWGDAAWIWDEANANSVAQNNEPRYLRLTFTLNAKPQAAELWITADNAYTAYVNGVSVGSDKQWEGVENYDVAKHLVVGKNVLAIRATNAGGVAGAIARLRVTTEDKKELMIVTDEKTKITRNAGANWMTASFDDAAWANAIVLGDPSIAPWNLSTFAQGKGKGKKGGGQFGYDTNETVPVKGRLTPEEQIKHFVVPKDFEIELVAADPLVINPITMVMDERGRIIVSESHTYRYGPKGSPIKPFANPVVRLDPDGKGGFKRVLIADGFDDPVMGIAVKGSSLWLTANNYLYRYDLPEANGEKKVGERRGVSPTWEFASSSPSSPRRAYAPTLAFHLDQPNDVPKPKPLATNKKTIVTDLNKAWNPFGMFVLEWGPDGKLYMSVGNHPINLQGPEKEKTSGRGSSGIIVRMNLDGTKMERLVHGLRVPYSFEYDPFGQLWLLSNGEGNPNRLVRVIEGVDYHCYSRPGVGNDWLAGNSPLAPPCEELHRGAHTQLMRYYAAAYPQEYQGNLFLCNWGAHGYAGPNRGIFRFVPDERNNITKREPLVWCKDPHFRPAHIILDQDGSLLIADWYGRDDESDMTGRIWRLKYVGKDRPVVKHKLDAAEWKDDDYAISALGSPSHLVREKAVDVLARRELNLKVAKLASKSTEPLAAANAIWTLARIGTADSKRCMLAGVDNQDWKVKRLALSLVRRLGTDLEFPEIQIDGKVEPVVRLEISRLLSSRERISDELIVALKQGAANDAHLRYESAWHLAKVADEKSITNLLSAADADVRLAGLIAIDIACYENFPTKKAALEALAKALENPGKLDHQLLLTVAQLDGDASIVPALEKLIARDDLPTATVARAVLVLKAKAGGLNNKLGAAAGKRLIEAVEKGSLKIASPADQLVIFEFLESEGPTPFALKQIEGQLRSNNHQLKEAAHALARRFGPKAASLADGLWPNVLNPQTKFEDTIDYLSTIARVEAKPDGKSWEKLLDHADPFVRLESVRWWRKFKDDIELADKLVTKMPDLISKDKNAGNDIVHVLRDLKIPSAVIDPKDVTISKEDLTKLALKELDAMPAGDRTKRAAMGLQVFERNACTKCHTTATATTLLAPSLKGIATQKVDYLIESLLYPSKIIKTGWEVEQIELKNGKIITGLVKDDGKLLRIMNLDKDERVPKSDIESRSVSKISVMPEGQEASLSRREFVDLIAYLQTLK